MEEIKPVQIGDALYVNVTPHDLDMLYEVTGEHIVIPSSGKIDAKPETVQGEDCFDIETFDTVFTPLPEGIERVKEIRAQYPNAVLLGSMPCVEAYKGVICGLMPNKGYERAPFGEKRMNPKAVNRKRPLDTDYWSIGLVHNDPRDIEKMKAEMQKGSTTKLVLE